jgi:mannose-6-phosphate isomerase-like protein (cupin superfamily)
MPTYSSKDFGATRRTPVAEIPERLIHQGVEELSTDAVFSEERRHPVFVVDLPSRTISLTVGHLAAKEATRKHRHTYETILYILEGSGRTYVEDRVVEWKTGDAVYVPVWAWHSHENTGDGRCRYLACENAPLLQNLGNVALREEA